MKALINVSATKIIYSALNILVLIWLLRLQAQNNWEAQILALYALLILSFPMGLILYTVVGAGLRFFAPDLGGLNNAYGYTITALFCAGMFVAGYVQWFKIVPHLRKKVGGKIW